jgi:hypothetical protein
LSVVVDGYSYYLKRGEHLRLMMGCLGVHFSFISWEMKKIVAGRDRESEKEPVCFYSNDSPNGNSGTSRHLHDARTKACRLWPNTYFPLSFLSSRPPHPADPSKTGLSWSSWWGPLDKALSEESIHIPDGRLSVVSTILSSAATLQARNILNDEHGWGAMTLA